MTARTDHAGPRRQQSSHGAQKRGFAGAVGAYHHHERADIDVFR
jgi:hypothetical protein